MKLRAYRKRAAEPGEHGFALIAILALAALVSAFLITSALNLTSAGVSNAREQRNMNALRQAKAALIAYAASEQWQLYKVPTTYFQPGALPCPDQDNDGDADCAGSLTASMIGRLPFKTLGIDDLHDASGERLWYALSHDFRKLQCPGTGCTTINSDTQGQLTVIGTAPATQVVAIVFAPGEAIQGQIRDPANANNPLNYLEGPPNLDNPVNVNYIFTSNAAPSNTFNDRLIVITQADLMAAVEPVVAARIERGIKPLIQTYFSKWNGYPYAAPFDPSLAQSAYLGDSSLTNGLLPLKNDATFTWASARVTTILNAGTGSYAVGGATISPDPTPCTTTPLQVTCQVNYLGSNNDRPNVRLEIFLQNANMVFADRPSPIGNPWTLTMIDGNGNPISGGSPYGPWSSNGSYVPTLTYWAQLAGGAVTYIGRLRNSNSTNHQVTITVPLPAASTTNHLPIVSSNPGPAGVNPNPDGAWFIANQWYRQTYYAVSPGYAPGGGGACTPLPGTPSCLTVNNLPTSYAPSNNKHVILVLAGRALDGLLRPSTNLPSYLEGQNSTPAGFIYEHRAGVPTAINDRVVVVSP